MNGSLLFILQQGFEETLGEQEKWMFDAKLLERDGNKANGCSVLQSGIVVSHVTLSILLN